MSAKFKNKYRIESARMPNWNYGWAASYFVTVCTDGRRHFFGKVWHNTMELSPIGEIVKAQWLRTLEIRPDMNLKLGDWVIMPNHMHAIITIGKNQFNSDWALTNSEKSVSRTGSRDEMLRVSTASSDRDDPNHLHSGGSDLDDLFRSVDDFPVEDPDLFADKSNIGNCIITKNKFGPQSKNISSIMIGFKSKVTTQARILLPWFKWQARYYDHVIRNEESFKNILEYIRNNPKNWKNDIFYTP